MNDHGDQIRAIEERIFVDVIKEKMVKESGAWKGSIRQNKDADKKVSVLIRNSLKAYEKNKKAYEKSFFYF